jgi:uncharacterized protein YecE (DUF72 family)
MYHSVYEPPVLTRMAERLHQQSALGRRAWCIFDNTAEFAATGNALDTLALVTARKTHKSQSSDGLIRASQPS